MKNQKRIFKICPLGDGVRVLGLILCAVVTGITLACERATQLTIEGGNPPAFVMSGSGGLGTIRVRGPEKQRDAPGEEAFLYWVIENKQGEMKNVGKIGPVIYGKVPDGYQQIYPENGSAPPLIEGERYNILIGAANADGINKYFVIRNGKAVVADY
jgi:hypothetical protein